jgi:hypothetical protein
MAKAGTGAAGSQLKRVGNYIAPQINKATDRLATKNRQQERIDATRANQEDRQLEKRLTDTKVGDDDFLTKATGVAGVDDFNRLLADVGVESAKGLLSQAREADASGDREGADNFRASASKVQASFKNMVNDIPVVREIMKGYEDDKASGKILDGSYQRMAIGGIMRGEVLPEIDNNGNWSLKVLRRNEETGKPILDENGEAEYTTYSIGDIKKGLVTPYYWNEETGADGELNKILVSLGKSKIDKINGGYIDTDQVWDKQRQNSLDNFIEGTVGVIGSEKEGESGNDKEMYKWHEYITGEEKFGDFTDAEKLKISQRIQDGVLGAYDTEESIKVAPRTAAQIRDSYYRRSGGGGAGKIKYSTGNTKTTEGKEATTFSTKDGFDLSEISFDKFDTGKVLKSTYNVALVDEDGKVFLSNGQDDIELNESQQVYIANELGLATVEEMLKVAEVRGSKKEEGEEEEEVSESNPLGI